MWKLFFLQIFILFLSSLSASASASDTDKLDTVQTQYGPVQGIPLTSKKGRTYYGFLGLQYGKVEERFSVGVPPTPWTEVKAAKTLPPPCFQYFVFTHKYMGVEDCLALNVYSPKPKKNAKLPVFVFIFPGGFQIGGASFSEAKYFMDEDAVLVTANYRLGALGFLNTGEGTVSGNMGLKDQVMALQWVKDNIAGFGGNPDLVTIFGVSAGGASVEYLSISEMSKGLFHRAISMSGSVLDPWAFQSNPVDLAEKLAENAGCSEAGWDWPKKVDCLRKKEASAVWNAQLKLMKLGVDLDFLHMKFVPSVESDKVKGPRFLKDTPYNLLSQGKMASHVPTLFGFTDNEGAFYIAPIIKDSKLVDKLNTDWNKIGQELFYFEDLVPSHKFAAVSKKIRDFYYKDGKISFQNRRPLSDIYSDRFFLNGIVKSMLLRGKIPEEQVYPYINSYHGTVSHLLSLWDAEELDGVGHADELIYLFNSTFGSPELSLGTNDGDFSKRLIKGFVKFAKTGKPPTWGKEKNWEKVTDGKELTFYKIDLKETTLIKDPYRERREFWESLKFKEHQNTEMDESKDEL